MPLIARVGINVIPVYLVAGMVIGPYGLGSFTDSLPAIAYVSISNANSVGPLAQLGVIFLLFLIALELTPEHLRRSLRTIARLGSTQVLVTTIVIAGVAYAFGNAGPSALVLGACLALSSTAVVSQHLLEKGLLTTTVGQNTLAILIAQDLAVVPILFLVTALGSESTNLGVSLILALAQAAAAIGLIILAGRWIIQPLFRLVNRSGDSDALTASVLLIIAATATLTHQVGLSAELGAFLVGLILAETVQRHEIQLLIAPLKGLFLGLFFLGVGMSIDPRAIVANPWWLPLSVVGLLSLKFAILYLLSRLSGLPPATALPVSLYLPQGGEFAFIVVGAAVIQGLISPELSQFMLLVVALTMLVTPFLFTIASRATQALHGRALAQGLDQESNAPAPSVLLIGYGRTGRLLAKALNDLGVPNLALDLDPELVLQGQTEGQSIFLGDASRVSLLHQLSVETYSVAVICTDNHVASHRILHSIRLAAPGLPVLVRVHDSVQASNALGAGATLAVPEVLETGLRLLEAVLTHTQVEPSSAEAVVHTLRATEDAAPTPVRP